MRYLLVSTENNDKKSIDIPNEMIAKPSKRKVKSNVISNKRIKTNKRLYKKTNQKSKPLLNRKNESIHHRNKR